MQVPDSKIPTPQATSHSPQAPRPTTAALIPAAGSGTRLGLGPKAFVEVGGLSLLARSVAALEKLVDEVVVALPEGMELPDGIAARAIVGGETRQDSVERLLNATTADTVLIHDAARPFLPEKVVLALLEAVAETGAATVALPVADTLVKAKNADWAESVPREGLWAVQTPQGFRRELLLQAHAQARADSFAATDDAGLVARLGMSVRLVPGDARLFKVTTPGDLALAEALARNGQPAPATPLPSPPLHGFASPPQGEREQKTTHHSPFTTPSTPRTANRAPRTHFAPAKINLGLSVLRQRPDRYHELHSLFARLNVGDTLEISPAETLTLQVVGADLPSDSRNLVYRAARAYLDAANVQAGANIVLHKHLPLASGLGGGSSDAATTLLALAELYPANVDLPALALQLGADVPFFLLGSAALVEGIGEKLTPLRLPPVPLVLLNPGVEVSARDAYGWLDEAQGFTPELDIPGILHALATGAEVPYFNALQPEVVARHPAIAQALAALAAAGLHSPLMSGSGSTCFALARSDQHAQAAAKAVAAQFPGWWVTAARTC